MRLFEQRLEGLIVIQPMFGPLNVRADGTHVFAAPIGSGHIPMIALSDIGFFARYSFDNRALVSGKELEVVSAMVSLDELVETFCRVTGEKAVARRLTIEEWFENFTDSDRLVASDDIHPACPRF